MCREVGRNYCMFFICYCTSAMLTLLHKTRKDRNIFIKVFYPLYSHKTTFSTWQTNFTHASTFTLSWLAKQMDSLFLGNKQGSSFLFRQSEIPGFFETCEAFQGLVYASNCVINQNSLSNTQLSTFIQQFLNYMPAISWDENVNLRTCPDAIQKKFFFKAGILKPWTESSKIPELQRRNMSR